MKNPYIVDRPLTDLDIYSGREASFSRLSRYLSADRRLILLFGRRYVGKTSFINQLVLRLSAHYVIHRVDLTPWPSEIADPIWYMVETIGRAMDKPAPDPALYRERTTAYLLEYLSALLPLQNEEDKIHLVCLDAVPVAEFARSPAWTDAIARLDSWLPQLASLAIMVALEGLSGELAPSPSLLDLPQITLEPLREDESEAILAGPVRGSLAFDYEVIRRVHRLSGGNPLFVQLFGRVLFDQRIDAGWVGLPEVEQAMEQVIAYGGPQFEITWQEASPRSRVVLCGFAEMMGHYGIGTANDIALYLRSQGVQMPPADIEAAIRELAAQQVLHELGGQTFRFSSELLRYWLRKNKSTALAVREARRYRQTRVRQIGRRGKRVDWVGVLLWVVALALAALIGIVWRSRQKGIVWTVEPTPLPQLDAMLEAIPTSPPPTPEREIASGLIVYIAKDEATDMWHIYKMRNDGSDPVRLTNSEGNDTSPVWSPDGRQIVFVSDRDGNREIYVMNADGNDQINLTNHPSEDWTPNWSPDGKQIVFASFRDGNWEIYVTEARPNAKPQRLTQSSALEYDPVWSPDGRRIAYVTNRDGNLEIYIMNADGSAQRRVTQDKATDQAPVWSPDGQALAWESYRDDNMEIYTANVDGSDLRNLSQDAQANDHGPTWSPDGRKIAFFSNREQGWDIYVLDLQTGQRRNLTNSPTLEQWPHWGP